MAGLKNTCTGFAYTIHSEEGRYMLHITDAAAILVRNKATRKLEVDLNRCPNLAYAEIYVTIQKLRTQTWMARNL